MNSRLRLVVSGFVLAVLAMIIGCGGGGSTYDPAKIGGTTGNTTATGGTATATGNSSGFYFVLNQPNAQNAGKTKRTPGPPPQNIDIFFAKLDGTGVKQVTHTGTDKFYITPSPDGTRVLFSDKGTEFVANADFSNPVSLGTEDGAVPQYHWSADSSTIVGATTGEFVIVSIYNKLGAVLNTIEDEVDKATSGISADGKTLFLDFGGRITKYNALTGVRGDFVAEPNDSQTLDTFAVSPDGKKIAYVFHPENAGPTLAILDLTTNVTKSTPVGFAFQMEWSPDSTKLAVISLGSPATKLLLVDLPANAARNLYTYSYKSSGLQFVYSPNLGWSTDSSTLLTSDDTDPSNNTDVLRFDGFGVEVAPSGAATKVSSSSGGMWYLEGIPSSIAGTASTNLVESPLGNSSGASVPLTSGGGLPALQPGIMQSHSAPVRKTHIR